MVKDISDCPSKDKTKREITFSYDSKNKKDIDLIKRIIQMCEKEQDKCTNCKNYYKQGCFGDYMANSCKIYGILEAYNNPHHDLDGSKCNNYIRL